MLYEARDWKNESDYIEAGSFQEALDLWSATKRLQWAEDWQDVDTPVSLTLLSRGEVIRGACAHEMYDERGERCEELVECLRTFRAAAQAESPVSAEFLATVDHLLEA
jgi:hypothetical protein